MNWRRGKSIAAWLIAGDGFAANAPASVVRSEEPYRHYSENENSTVTGVQRLRVWCRYRFPGSLRRTNQILIITVVATEASPVSNHSLLFANRRCRTCYLDLRFDVKGWRLALAADHTRHLGPRITRG